MLWPVRFHLFPWTEDNGTNEVMLRMRNEADDHGLAYDCFHYKFVST